MSTDGGDVAPPRRRLRRVLAAGLVMAALVALDLRRPPDAQASAKIAVGGIHLYQATLSRLWPVLGVHCRFEPTCSHYAEAAIRADGAWRGSARAARRIVRCGPWTPAGTVDPP